MVTEILSVTGQFKDTVTYVGAKEDLYIIYGDGTIHNDKVEASYDGSFKFEFLQPGTYTIFGYTEVLHLGANIPKNDDDYKTYKVVSKTITIGKKDQGDIGSMMLWKNDTI